MKRTQKLISEYHRIVNLIEEGQPGDSIVVWVSQKTVYSYLRKNQTSSKVSTKVMLLVDPEGVEVQRMTKVTKL